MCLYIADTIEDTILVSITDVNDEIPVCERQSYSVSLPEDFAVDTIFLSLICFDRDNDPLNVNSNISSYVIINGNTGI